MSFFDRLKDTFSSDLNLSEKWVQPENVKDLNPIFSKSEGLNLIFKHSKVCGTSIFALRNMEKIQPEIAEGVNFYIIDVRSQRKLSNHVEQKTGIRHESPQLIILKGGDPVWSASHSAIYPENVTEHIQKFK
jgi:bacillithiol system protein YtxJ